MVEVHHTRVWSDMTDPGICAMPAAQKMPTTKAVALAHGFKPAVLGNGGDGDNHCICTSLKAMIQLPQNKHTGSS